MIVTDPNYWDCECEGGVEDFIHPKSETFCPKCGAISEDQPDSRAVEVDAMKVLSQMRKES